MKKRIICGSAAILMTGLTVSIVTTAEPMPWFALRDMTDAAPSALYHYVRDLGPAGEAAPTFVEPGKPVKTPVLRFPS